MNEDGEIEVHEKLAKGSTPSSRRDARANYRKNRVKIKKQRNLRKGKRVDPTKSRIMKRALANLDFDPSDVAADSAVAMGEEENIDEYTAGVQTRPTNVTVWRTIGGELKKVKRWTSRGKKGINLSLIHI